MVKIEAGKMADNEGGMGATICYHSDCYPATIIDVSASGRRITVRQDKAHVVKGSEHDGSAEYIYEPDEDGHQMTFSLRKDGRWRVVGAKSPTLTLGIRRKYRDPHF